MTAVACCHQRNCSIRMESLPRLSLFDRMVLVVVVVLVVKAMKCSML